MHTAKLRERVEVLLSSVGDATEQRERANRLYQGTLTLIEAVYGPQSTQLQAVKTLGEQFLTAAVQHRHMEAADLLRALRGVLTNVKDDLDAGLPSSIHRQVTGAVIGDVVALAREALASGEQAKNVAAVLTAAAYEDTIRRMGEAFAGVRDRPKLESVVGALKETGTLVGPEVAITNSHLKFRNDALHADWENITSIATETVLAFTEGLLMKHFTG